MLKTKEKTSNEQTIEKLNKGKKEILNTYSIHFEKHCEEIVRDILHLEKIFNKDIDCENIEIIINKLEAYKKDIKKI